MKPRTRAQKECALLADKEQADRISELLDHPDVDAWMKGAQTRAVAAVVGCPAEDLLSRRAELKALLEFKSMILGLKAKGKTAEIRLAKLKEDENVGRSSH